MLSSKTQQSLNSSTLALATGGDFFRKKTTKIDCAILSSMPEELEYYDIFFSNTSFELIKIESFTFKIYDYNSKKILIACTGLGTIFASSLLTLVHCHFHPDYVLFSGTAGGINTTLNIGDILIAEQAYEAEIQEAFKLLPGTPFENCLNHPLKKENFPAIYKANDELVKIAKSINDFDKMIHCGTVVSSNAFPAPLDLYEKIKQENPYSIDMETSALYQIAWLLKIPVLVIRGISNLLDANGGDKNINQSDVKGSATAAAKFLLKIFHRLLFKNTPQNKLAENIEGEVNQLIDTFKLEPHPEGGFFVQNFKSKLEVKSSDNNRYNDENRSAGSSIYYLLKGNDFSAWHSLSSDEIWHFYKGSPVIIHVLNNQGIMNQYILGDPAANPKANFQVIIKAGDWFAAENLEKNSYSFVGCTVSPGFEFMDFKLGNGLELSTKYPQFAEILLTLSRPHLLEGSSLANDSGCSIKAKC
jgi:uncharacterized protein